MRLFFLFFLLWQHITLSAANPTIKCEEIGRLTLPDGYPSVYYKVSTHDFPEGKPVSLFLLRLNGKKELVETLTPSAPQESIQMLAYFRPGEPFRFIAETDKGIATAAIKIVPLPIEAMGADGCKVSVEMASEDGSAFLCLAQGFDPGEKIRFCSVSLGNTIDEVATTGADGSAMVTLKPAVKKKKGGKCALELRSQKETLAIKFGWGREALQKPTAAIADIPSDKAYHEALDRMLR